MNRRVQIFAGLLVLLLVTGGLTSFIAANGSGNLVPGVLTVTGRPEASVTQFGGDQGLWLIGAIAFILFNLIGASLTFALIGWFLSREVTRAKALEPAKHESIGEAFQLRQGGAKQDENDTDSQLPAATS